MKAIFNRELKAYFSSPIGYIFIAVFYGFSGFFFYGSSLFYGLASLSMVYEMMFTVVLFLIPLLTMRLFSEDKKLKTDQALLTAPISLLELVLGKFLASMVVYILGITIIPVFGLVLSTMTSIDWSAIVGSYLGMLLFGGALISIGMFISALTENQVVSAVGAYVVSILTLVMTTVSSLMPNEFLKSAVYSLSMFVRYAEFTSGIIYLSNVIFFLSVAVLFCYLTARVFEKRRWA